MSADRSLAESTSFITFGAFSCVSAHDQLYKVWGQGGVELHAVFIRAAQIEQSVYEILCEAPDWHSPGCWAYDVSEEIGSKIGQRIINGGEVDKDWLQSEIIALCCNYAVGENKEGVYPLSVKVLRRLIEPAKEAPKVENTHDALTRRVNELELSMAKRCFAIEQKMDRIVSETRTTIRSAFGKAHDAL